MNTSSRITWRMPPWILACLGVFCTVPAPADTVDWVFLKNAPQIFSATEKLGVSDVAVLNFSIRRPDGQVDFRSGVANIDLARRLENTLILANNDKAPLMVLTGSGEAARKLPANTTWKTVEGRKTLATIGKLPIAWDSTNSALPQAFVTGELAFSADYRSITITLYGFTAQQPAELKSLLVLNGYSQEQPQTIPTDRGVLAMAGIGYVISHIPESSRNQTDVAAQKSAAEAFAHSDGFKQLAGASPIRLEFLINGQPIKLYSDPLHPGVGKFVPSALDPKRGDEVAFRLTNTSDKDTYAALLAVNGRNTNSLNPDACHLNEAPPHQHRMWVLEPGQTFDILGFYESTDGKYRKFEVLNATESEANFNLMSDLYRGLVTLHVFQNKPPMTPPDPAPRQEEVQKEAIFLDASTITLGMGGASVNTIRNTQDLKKAQEELAKRANVILNNGSFQADPHKTQLVSRGLIVDGQVLESAGPIKRISFDLDPAPIAFLRIRYYDRPQ
ncbi:MAG: hypothetical protein LC104_20215 [Bacteroidales bacterium]|nr:hypothetical protein [Bacteroidales bacterium]